MALSVNPSLWAVCPSMMLCSMMHVVPSKLISGLKHNGWVRSDASSLMSSLTTKFMDSSPRYQYDFPAMNRLRSGLSAMILRREHAITSNMR